MSNNTVTRYGIEFHAEVDSPSEVADMLRHIADLVESGYTSGYTSGYYPGWKLTEREV